MKFPDYSLTWNFFSFSRLFVADSGNPVLIMRLDEYSNFQNPEHKKFRKFKVPNKGSFVRTGIILFSQRVLYTTQILIRVMSI